MTRVIRIINVIRVIADVSHAGQLGAPQEITAKERRKKRAMTKFTFFSK